MTEVKHQIYVSYADADEEWVIHFVKGLKDNLRHQLGGIDDNFIWAKFMPLGLGNKQEILQRHLKASEYLLVVMSPAYLKAIGNSEIASFGKIDDLILIEHDKVRLPDDLQSLNSYPFWHEDDRGQIIKLGFPVPDVKEGKYFQLLDRVARAIQSHNSVSNQQPTEPNLSVDSKTPRSPGVSAPPQAPIYPQCVVITVTDTEDSAFRDVLKGHNIEPPTFQKHEHLGYYNRFFLQNQHCALIRPTEKGRQASQTLVNKLLRYPPQLIIMMGICGGFNERGVKLNDVIFAHSVVDYERERLTDDKYRAGIQPQQYRTSPHLLELIVNFKTELTRELKIRIHHEKILASGDKLLASREHELRQKILDIHPDIYGIEMEGSGFYRAVHDAQIAHLDVTVIKAVSDLGDEQMAKGKEKKQQKAAKIAAQVTLKVIEQYFAS